MGNVTKTLTRLENVDVLLSILDNLPTSIFVKDENLNFVYSNHLHCQLIGKSEEELLGRSDHDFYPANEARAFALNDQRVIDEGITNISEEWASREDGMSTPVVSRKSRHAAPDGKIYLIGTNADMSDIKRREDQYKALTETVPVGVLQFAQSGGIIFSNSLFNNYCGGDGAPEARERIVEKFKEAYVDFPGTACRFETKIVAPGAQVRTVIVISSGWLQLPGSEPTATVSVIDVTEMTELRRINDEVSRLNHELATNMRRLNEANDELVKKGRMEQLGQLTATVAHELRNPLGAVRTSAFLLERKLKDKNLGVEQQIDRINKGVVRCDNIITQLLDFSRNKQLNCQSSDLDQWLVTVLEEEARKLPSVVSIECHLGMAGIDVPFDPSRMQRAIVNLIANASEALVGQGEDPSKYAHETPTITVSTKLVGDEVALVVADNGPGIPPEVMSRIREPLFTTKSFGTGLGVPAIEQIVLQHGGRLDITSVGGKGAAFSLFLPLQPKELPETEKAA